MLETPLATTTGQHERPSSTAAPAAPYDEVDESEIASKATATTATATANQTDEEKPTRSSLRKLRDRVTYRSRSSTSARSSYSSASSRSGSKKVSANINGNTIDSEHQQYELSIAMMVGIRCTVKKNAHEEKKKQERAKVSGRDLSLIPEDYAKVERYVFPLSKKSLWENSPSETKLLKTFKFRAYSQRVFSKIRQLFGIEDENFIESLCGNSNFIEFMSNSNSGEFFFYSQDGRYMIKTQTYAEIKFIRQILPHYYEYLVDNPNSFLTHYYGVYHVKIPHTGLNLPFVIMRSVFDTEKRIHRMWDLKGSTLGRKAREGETVQKDMDIVEKGEKLNIGPEKKSMVVNQLQKDATFLAEMNIMDYSLLVGVHSRQEERVRYHMTLSESIDDSDVPVSISVEDTRKNSPMPDDEGNKDGRKTLNVNQMRELAHLFLEQATDGECGDDTLSTDDSSSLCDSEDYVSPTSIASSSVGGFVYSRPADCGDNDSQDSEDSGAAVIEHAEASDDHVEVLWVTAVNGITERDDLGIDSWMVDTECMQSKEIYFIGVIDILQRYTTRKMAEHYIKATHQNAQDISCVDPEMYADRFVKFCASVME